MPTDIAADELVPDKQVRLELGGQSEMTTNRWDKSEKMAALGWPAPIRINGRKYRSRQALNKFRDACVHRAIAERAQALEPKAKPIAQRDRDAEQRAEPAQRDQAA